MAEPPTDSPLTTFDRRRFFKAASAVTAASAVVMLRSQGASAQTPAPSPSDSPSPTESPTPQPSPSPTVDAFVVRTDKSNKFMVSPAVVGTSPVIGPQQTGADAFSLLRVDTSSPDRGPWLWNQAEYDFNGRSNPVAYFGYNTLSNGTTAKSDEPGVALGFEGLYYDGVKNNVEGYVQYTYNGGAGYFRPWSFQIDRENHRLVELTLLAPLQIKGAQSSSVQVADVDRNTFTVYAPLAQTNLFTIEGASGFGSRLDMRYNAHRALSILPTAIDKASFELDGRPILRLYTRLFGAVSHGLAVGTDDNSAAGVFAVNDGPTSLKAVVARGRPGQVASILEVQDGSLNIQSRFDKNGYFMTRKTTAPADADLATGELAVWLDPSALSTKVMFKAKDSTGRVKTASVKLG